MMAVQTQAISQDGNVMLEVGQPITTRLQVSSKVLAAASHYFAALLGPRFREGRTLLAFETVNIPVPEDNPRAMGDMCRLLHGQNVPELADPDVSAERIYDLAVVVDKVNFLTLTESERAYF